MGSGERHSWVKLRIHVYICVKCGAGRENKQDRIGGWYTTWFLPTGERRNTFERPPCVRGPLTDRYLGKYADHIEAAVAVRSARRGSRDVQDAG
jgi:hypothetical protein